MIIVGAGPGGAYLATLLAQASLDVLVLEKETLPRYKPCGGGVSFKAAPILGPELFNIAEDIVDTLILSNDFKNEFRFIAPNPMVVMVSRDKFDYWLAQRAIKAGAKLVTGQKANKITLGQNGVKVLTTDKEWEGKIVVGADGVNSLVAKALDLRQDRTYGLTLEGEFDVPPDLMNNFRGVMHLDLACIPSGYGWIFPKKDHLSVGIGTFSSRASNIKSYFQDFLAGKGLSDYLRTRHIQGFLLPYYKGKAEPLSVSRGLLLGDAAGLVDPFTGEGIYYALRSAELASQAINNFFHHDMPLKQYDQFVVGEFDKELRRAYLLGKLIYLFPGFTHKFLSKNKNLVLQMCLILSGDKHYQDCKISQLLKGLLSMFI